MSDGVMTYEDWLRGCVHHDGRNGYVTLPCDEVLKIADFIERLRTDRKTENSSEKPNNCEHITEDGVTCAKYPACDDCLDNPLNKVKGSERSLKGKDEPQRDCFLCKWLGEVDVCGRCRNRNLFAEADTEPKPKDEPQTHWHYDEQDATWYPYKHEDEPQQKSCATCKHALGNWDGESNNCGRCCGADRRFYEPIEDEPQTEVETMSCAECKHRPIGAEICEEPCRYEPQTEREASDESVV